MTDATITAPAARDIDYVIRSTPLGGSALSRALQEGDPRVADWMATRPQGVDGWRSRMADTRDAFAGRDWLTALAPAFAATGPAARRLARAAESGVVVTTGQQPGLFGGPMYTWTKAIGALAFADALEQATGMPVAPVFWAATDDSDWLEAAVTHVVGHDGVRTLSLEGPPTDGQAMAEVPLGPLAAAMSGLREACGSAAHRGVLDLVRDAYVPHATIGDAYVQLLRGLLEPLGIAVLDAAHDAVRQAADPMLRRALAESAAIAAALDARTADITASGFAPQVEARDDLSLVFRTRIHHHADGTRRVRERVPVADATRAAREAEPGTLGPNVLLRPIVERSMLPTVAYHAGPGELAYFAQVMPVATALGVEVPLAVPRWSGEIIDDSAFRALERLALDETALHQPHVAEQRIARAALDVDTADSIDRLRVAVETQMRALADAVQQDEAIVSALVVSGLARDLEHRIARFERRVLAAMKRREAGAMRDLALARAALRPHGASPERVLNLVPFLARYGSEVFEELRAAARDYTMRLVQGNGTTT